MKIYVDLDNTLCKTVDKNYENSTPILERIAYFNSLKDQGNSITIWTARGSVTGIDYFDLTKKQLLDWGVKHDELLLGKPPYDLYYDDKSHNIDDFIPLKDDNMSRKQKVEIVPKGWGKEIIFANNDEYCGKILCFDKGKKFSMHYHLLKKESWYINKGSFLLVWINTEKGIWYTEELKQGDVITNERGSPHQLLALEDAEVFEVSTRHYDEDSYRTRKGD